MTSLRLNARILCALLLVLSTTISTSGENRLGKESSPYLKLHAHNPVDWYPWGEEALNKAKKENKVIFLSVGYSSCYWCHVMERESFMDEEIAKYLNDNFVCIKVDREERPDVDAIYMLAVQIASGGGGWPMSVFMTPEGKPFFGDTYFPARDGDRPGRKPGFLTVINRIHETWKANEANLRASGDQMTKLIKQNINGQAPKAAAVPLNKDLIMAVRDSLIQQFDPQYGGFGFDPGQPSRPKFPEPSNLYLLAHLAGNNKDARALEMLESSLQKMHSGGIWDHVGGGFHRYSVDRFWQIPHFEKMLYDNGQLAVVYTQAFELTKKPEYKRVVERMLDWALREMRDEGGAFYSALDAESEKVEGKYYRWGLEETQKILGDSYEAYSSIYGFNDPPNFEHEFYVPQLAKPLAETAAAMGTNEQALWQKLKPMHLALRAARDLRVRPLTDTKVLASWNGLMIRGFADAGRVLNKPEYTKAAAEAADFVLTKMRNDKGRLYRTHTSGEAKLNAYLDDYAFVCDGLIALHKATRDKKWLTSATELTDLQIKHYQDEKLGGFFFTSDDHELLIARGKLPTDGAQPSGNSVTAQNLIYLAKELKRPDYLEVAKKTISSAAPAIKRTPRIAPRMTLALAEFLED